MRYGAVAVDAGTADESSSISPQPPRGCLVTESNPSASAFDPREIAGSGVDAPDFGTLAWLRRASGDVRLPAWRLTPERLAAYVAGARALRYAGPGIEADDPGAVLDPNRQPLLRPWEYPPGYPGPGDRNPAHALAEFITQQPTLSAVLRPEVDLAEFGAAQLKLTVCARALVLLFGDDVADLVPDRLQAWLDAQQPGAGAEADFAASLLTTVEGYGAVTSAFAT